MFFKFHHLILTESHQSHLNFVSKNNPVKLSIMPRTNWNDKTKADLEAEREHVHERITYCLDRLADPQRRYTAEDRTELLDRLEGYVIRMMKLPKPDDADLVNKQSDLSDKFDALVSYEIVEGQKACTMLRQIRNRHRIRVRRQLQQTSS
jgi:hypothetical protein